MAKHLLNGARFREVEFLVLLPRAGHLLDDIMVGRNNVGHSGDMANDATLELTCKLEMSWSHGVMDTLNAKPNESAIPTSHAILFHPRHKSHA